MKKYLLIAILFLVPVSIAAQCSQGSVCVPQTTIDQAAAAATELLAARDAIKAFAAERVMTAAERKSAETLIAGLSRLVETQDKIIAEKDIVINLYKEVVTMYQGVVQRLQDQANKPKSGFQKFLGVLEKVVILLAGVSIGRGVGL